MKLEKSQILEILAEHEPDWQYRGSTYGWRMTCYRCDQIAPCRVSKRLKLILKVAK